MIHRHEEDNVVREREGVRKKDPDLTPGRIGDDPIVLSAVLQEIAPALELTPSGASGQTIKNMAIAGTGLENATAGGEVGYELSRECRRGLDIVVGDVVAIRLVAHTYLQVSPGDSVQTKKRPGSSFEKPGHKPGNDLLSRDLTSYYHWLRGA